MLQTHYFDLLSKNFGKSEKFIIVLKQNNGEPSVFYSNHSDTKEPTCGINYRMNTEKRTPTNCSRNRYQIRIWLAATCRNHMLIYLYYNI